MSLREGCTLQASSCFGAEGHRVCLGHTGDDQYAGHTSKSTSGLLIFYECPVILTQRLSYNHFLNSSHQMHLSFKEFTILEESVTF